MKIKPSLLFLPIIMLFMHISSFQCENASPSGCPNNWRPFRTKCYKMYGYFAGDRVPDRNFNDARDYCASQNGSLVTINSMEEQNFLTSYLGEPWLKRVAWIGLQKPSYRAFDQQRGKWIDSSEDSDFRYFAPGEPNGGNVERCFTMDIRYNIIGMWNDVPCSDTEGFICQMSRIKSGDDFPISTNPSCPEGFSYYNKVCFKLVKDKADFWSAESDCENSFNGHLTSIRDMYDEAFLATLALDVGERVWIGISDHNNDLIKGRFAWTDGGHMYHTNWGQGQPAESSEDRCVALSPNGWTVEGCLTKHSFVCSKPLLEYLNDQEIHIGVCPQGWIDVNNRYCYYIESSDRETFGRAVNICAGTAKSGKLAWFESQHELLLLGPHLRKFTNKEFLLGIKQSRDDAFKYRFVKGQTLGQTATFLPWALGEPSSISEEKCVEVDSRTLKYNNVDCAIEKSYICQIDKEIHHSIFNSGAIKSSITLTTITD